MRILHLLSQTELTGAEVYAQNLVQAQLERGHEVHVVSDRLHVPMGGTFSSLPLSTSRWIQKFRNIRALRRLIREQNFDVLHCHSRGAVRHAYWARWGLSSALVTTLHGRQHFSWSKRLFHTYGELLIAICENVKSSMVSDFRMPGSSIRVLRNPISISDQKSPHALKTRFHLALVGRSSGPKGRRFETIAQTCFLQWLREIPDLQISIIAPQPERFSTSFHDDLREIQKQFPDRLHLRGRVDSLREHLTQFDLVIGSGRVAIESVMDGIPTIALGEYTSHGLVRASNLDEILQTNFGDIGRDKLENPLSTDHLRNEVMTFYKSPEGGPSAEELRHLQQAVENEFSENRIRQGVESIYRAARFKRAHPRWIPILMYHKVPENALQTQHRIFVEKQKFKRHLEFFKKRKFQTLTFQDLRDFWEGRRPFSTFPKRPLILTFDDGYQDNLKNAEPLLRAHGFRATLFLLANHDLVQNTWDSQTGEPPAALLTFEEKKKLDPKVWEIGSHGFHHEHLPSLPPSQALNEMKQSKQRLEVDFKNEVVAFAYPFGSTNSAVARLAEEAGYLFAVNTDQGGLHLADDPHSIFRVNVFPEDGTFALWKKTSTWYRRSFFRKRGR